MLPWSYKNRTKNLYLVLLQNYAHVLTTGNIHDLNQTLIRLFAQRNAKQQTCSPSTEVPGCRLTEGHDESFDPTEKRRHAHAFRIGDKFTIEGTEKGVMTKKMGKENFCKSATEKNLT